ncbi:MAG: hypothetical protein DRR16_24530 [Candidatus Parabeggiatoa sp. nov. 3]|nr:MAG: hypothetical protein DRR00_28255 [Gammaproteobacteria bacterium]RKZ61590.1 MAG: hypothetical protein DRQ99_20170 [Gammaproteobacteria bacterium]RKZ80071.1 MAG: hypothetical protein DRR16_24530 [Gammaproteobacteria bacterium]
MNSSAIKRMEIVNELSFIPDNQIDSIKTFIEFLLFRNGNTAKKNTRSLQDIWKNKGFEKIVDLESEIKAIRKQLSDSIINKKV